MLEYNLLIQVKMSNVEAGLFAPEYALVNSYIYCYICYHIILYQCN